MAWAIPPTFPTAKPLPASDLNILTNNQLYLLQKPSAKYVTNESVNYTVTNTSFEDVDSTNLSLTITTAGGDVLVGLVGTADIELTEILHFDITVDAVKEGGDDGLWAVRNDGNERQNCSATHLVTGLVAAAYTFNLQWKTTAGTATLYAGAGTTNYDVHAVFWVKEI